MSEIIELFSLEAVNKSSAFFDVAKLRHINGEYLRRLDHGDFCARAEPFLADGPWPAERFVPAVFDRIAPLVQERVATLDEVPAMVDFLFRAEPAIDDGDWAKASAPPAAAILDDTIAAYSKCEWSADVLHDALLHIGEFHGLKLGKAQAPVRVAVTGRRVGPPLFESLELLGRDDTIRRLRSARARLG